MPGETPEIDAVLRSVKAGDVAALTDALGADLHPDASDAKGTPLLIAAATAGHPEIVSLLLERGADIALTNKGGRTPLASAAYRGHVEVIRVLAKHGADLDYVDASGRTALMYAATFNQPDAAWALRDVGADVDARGPGGRTAAQLAEAAGSNRVADVLSEAEAPS